METINYRDYVGPVQTDERIWMSVDDYLDEMGSDHADYIAVAEQQALPKLKAETILDYYIECSDLWHDNADDICDIVDKHAVEELQSLLDKWNEKHYLANCYMESRTQRVYLDREEIAKDIAEMEQR